MLYQSHKTDDAIKQRRQDQPRCFAQTLLTVATTWRQHGVFDGDRAAGVRSVWWVAHGDDGHRAFCLTRHGTHLFLP